MKAYTPAEKQWLRSRGNTDEEIAAAESAGLPFVDLLSLVLNLAPALIAMIQKLLNLFNKPPA